MFILPAFDVFITKIMMTHSIIVIFDDFIGVIFFSYTPMNRKISYGSFFDTIKND